MSGIVAGLEQLGRDVVLDGEAVCQLPDGRSDFHALRGEDGCRRAVLWTSDLLMLDSEDLRPLPIEIRRERLQHLLSGSQPQGIAFSEDQENHGAELFAAACQMNLEGIVAKRKGTRYTSGRCRHQLKIKNPEFVRRARMHEDRPVNTLEDGWAALRMIREAIETLGPPGALISEEAVLATYGPEYQHEAQAICDALAVILSGEKPPT